MKLDYIKEKKELISVALSGISVLFAVLIFMKVTSYFKLSASAQDIVQTIKARENTKPDDPNKYLGPAKEMANSLKKNNLFAPPQEKRNPITEVRCILDNEAFINGSYYKEGAMVQDAKVVKIEPTQVTIEWDGKTTVYRPMDAAMASAGPSERASSRTGSPQPGPSSPSRGTVVPPPQEQPPPGAEGMPPAGPSIVPNIPPSQGQPPEQIQKQLMDAMQKARSMNGKE